MMVKSVTFALVALLPAPLLHAATASVEGNVVQVRATGDGRFGGCMAALDVVLADAGLDCAGSWVTFSCTGEHAEKEGADRMFESLRAAVVGEKSVEMRVTDEKKHDQYCHASRIKIQDAPHVDVDSDGDGVLDLEDDVPLNASETVDTDDDGVGNNEDDDDDNDGVSDNDDAFPLDAGEWVDTDGDGVGDNADPDDDNDGALDIEDDCPLDPDDNCPRPDLSVESPSASRSSVSEGESFTFSVTVRNRGTGQSQGTTLRYYRSTDTTIARDDMEVGTDEVAELAASGSVNASIDLTAPESPGTYHYGACVDDVDQESDTGDNCSGAVGLRVGDVSSGTDVSVGNSTCSGRRLLGNLVSLTMTGTVTASVSVSDVRVNGYGNNQWVGSDSWGDISAGDSENFSISGRISTTARVVSCTVDIAYVRADAGSSAESINIRLSEEALR